MPVNIKITDQETEQVTVQEPQGVKIEVVEKDEVEGKLKLRSALNGDLMIMDHKDIDIVLKPNEKKIVAFAKETLSDLVYGAESRLLEYLRKQGILKIDSIQGGNVYGSLEGQLHESDKAVEITLMKISEWMETEQPMMSGRTGYDDMNDEHLLSPDGEYSTELGEVPAAEKKGSITQSNLFAPYLYGRYTYE
tara:strand:+ start:973 stop:1551 length:579 start_codon:yes stop_codon:yes gene_type:complete